MKKYKTNEEFFDALCDLAVKIEAQGNDLAANELRQGLSCINGLTDGWALLMESIEKTVNGQCGEMGTAEISELTGMLRTVKKVVYRHLKIAQQAKSAYRRLRRRKLL